MNRLYCIVPLIASKPHVFFPLLPILFCFLHLLNRLHRLNGQAWLLTVTLQHHD